MKFTAKQVKDGALNEEYLHVPYKFTVRDSNGNTFHVECAQKDASAYGDNDPAKDCDSARIFESFNHWEGEDLICDYCSKPIHSVYGDPTQEEKE